MNPMDEAFMRVAIEEAEAARQEGNQPFGAVVVRDGQVVAKGHNLTMTDTDPTAHGEVVALRKACQTAGSRTLEGATLYTTCEPCLLCTGAAMSARVERVVLGAEWTDAPEFFEHPEKGSLLLVAPHLTLPYEVTRGILREECARFYNGRD